MESTDRFFQLASHVRHYTWGMRRRQGAEPFIADLLGVDGGESCPWAELWIGAHPSLSSELMTADGTVRLDEFLAASVEEVLGELPQDVEKKKLPFLLKVLSCERALSIQSHPDKENAKRLHEHRPLDYPDGNHKPEVIIALTPFEALAGFRNVDEIVADLEELSSLEPWRRIYRMADRITLKVLCESLLNMPGRLVRDMLVDLWHEFSECDLASDSRSALCQKLQCGNPCDRGVLFAYLLNHVRMVPGEALYIPANEPHAYLNGTGIECMANSDNVIRAGLTTKVIDIRALLSTLNFDTMMIEKNKGRELSGGERVYETPAHEFRVSVFDGDEPIEFSRRRRVAGVMLVLDGSYEFDDGEGTCRKGIRGTTWFRPASVSTGIVRPCGHGSRLVLAEVGTW